MAKSSDYSYRTIFFNLSNFHVLESINNNDVKYIENLDINDKIIRYITSTSLAEREWSFHDFDVLLHSYEKVCNEKYLQLRFIRLIDHDTVSKKKGDQIIQVTLDGEERFAHSTCVIMDTNSNDIYIQNGRNCISSKTFEIYITAKILMKINEKMFSQVTPKTSDFEEYVESIKSSKKIVRLDFNLVNLVYNKKAGFIGTMLHGLDDFRFTNINLGLSNKVTKKDKKGNQSLVDSLSVHDTIKLLQYVHENPQEFSKCEVRYYDNDENKSTVYDYFKEKCQIEAKLKLTKKPKQQITYEIVCDAIQDKLM